MSRHRWRQRRNHDVEELNITAFMNLMVILVPFLLITAVFSQVTILELSLPAPTDDVSSEELPDLQLELTLRREKIEVGDANTGLLKEFAKDATATGFDFVALSEFLQQVKARYPDNTAATLLLEPDIEYDMLVQVMDAVRVFKPEGDSQTHAELFPEISIGDAVAVQLTSAVAKQH